MDDETRIRMMDIARKSSKGKKDKSKKKETGAVLMLQSTLSKIPEPPKKKIPTIQPGFQLSIRDLKGKQEETFTVIKKVGTMNYLANRAGTPHTYFVKIENYESHNAPKQLKREILLLEELRRSPHAENFKNFFPHVTSKGRVKDAPTTEGFNFVIERYAPTPVNKLLPRLSKPDVARFANQSFQFIRFLHEELSWIHRNIGPNAFRFGTAKHPPARLTMVSFGYAVRWKPAMVGKPPKSPRKMVRRADPTFMPRSYYHVRDFLPKDDIEMWIYMIVYAILPDLIKWDAKTNDVTALTMKEQFFCMDVTVDEYAVIPRSIQVIIKYLYKLDSKTPVDYKLIQSMLDNMSAFNGCLQAETEYDFLKNVFRTEPYEAWKPVSKEKIVAVTPKKIKKPSKVPPSSKNSSAPDSSDPFNPSNEPVVFKATGSSKKNSSKKAKPKPPTAAALPKAAPNEFGEMPEDNDPFDMAAVIGEGEPPRPDANAENEEEAPIEPPPPPPRQPPSPVKTARTPGAATPVKKAPIRQQGCKNPPKRGKTPKKAPLAPVPAAAPQGSPSPDDGTPPSPVPFPANEATDAEDVTSSNKQGETIEPTGKTETVGENGDEKDGDQQFYDMTTTNSSTVATSKATPTVFAASKVPSTKDEEDPKEEL